MLMIHTQDADRIEFIDEWLDVNVGLLYKEQPLGQDWARIAKVQEELGEATAAFIALTQQNPRKAEIGTKEALLEELADTALTAILAMQHFTKDSVDTEHCLTARLIRLADRIQAIEKRKLEIGAS